MRFDFRKREFDPPELDAIGMWEVLIDGQHLRHCFYGDDQLGEVQCYDLRNGEPYFDPETNDVAVQPIRRGVVVIRRRPHITTMGLDDAN